MSFEEMVKSSSERTSLEVACHELWDQYIRIDLIFSRNLWLCLPCLAFFHASPDADHPRDQCVLVQRFFAQRSITSPEKLVDFMMDAAGYNLSNTKIPADLHLGPKKPTMSKVHIKSAPKRPPSWKG